MAASMYRAMKSRQASTRGQPTSQKAAGRPWELAAPDRLQAAESKLRPQSAVEARLRPAGRPQHRQALQPCAGFRPRLEPGLKTALIVVDSRGLSHLRTQTAATALRWGCCETQKLIRQSDFGQIRKDLSYLRTRSAAAAARWGCCPTPSQPPSATVAGFCPGCPESRLHNPE